MRLIAEGFVAVIALGTLLLWCSVPNTAPLAERNPASTAFIDLRRAQAESEGRPWKLAWKWRPIGQISRYLRAAVIYAEDYNFYRHEGIDWDAIESAMSTDLGSGKLVGGSTITQQLAKNLYLSPSRSVIRKAREMLIAYSLEDHLSKQRILELYLNVVEWGDGVFGAEAAAQRWFGHSAQSLSPAEAVRLAIALPNPIKRAPNVESPDLTKKAVRIIRLLRMQGLIDGAQERASLDRVGAPDEPVLPTRPTAAAPTTPSPSTSPTSPTPPPVSSTTPTPTAPPPAQPSTEPTSAPTPAEPPVPAGSDAR